MIPSSLPTSSTPDLPEIPQETNAGTPENVGTAKTVGLDNPENHGAAAKPLVAYSIESSDDESEGDGNGILKLEAGDYERVTINKNVQAVDMNGSLCLIHVPDNAKIYIAWHMEPGDLTFLASPNPQAMAMAMKFFPEVIRAAEAHTDYWKNEVQKYPGTTYLCGPVADELAQNFFNVDPANVVRTEKGPVSVTFDIATRSFHTN
ncbi:hypothetical protein [Salinisphaera sp. G21_0]|uniref:hypothetical protein n=1 Tax=Salinisphaera sp. G21_0 TaxID=2821094 RepID=UPI001AD9CDA2|nr:hypothetical protein [Salinisphaera sp. G21_0]MBO9481155.1 hypothetical protein [Salinisphaera sp. G21_0]